jgi:hypothetical protein
MEVQIKYQFQGRDREFITQPLKTGLYDNLEDYKREVLRWFPDATVEIVPDTNDSKIIEFEL